jgi:molecular chaperone GrpE
MIQEGDDTARGTCANTPENSVPVETSLPEVGEAAPAIEPDASRLVAEKDAEIKLLIDRLKRLQAEFENYRKRGAREAALLRERAADDEICSFLPLFDSFERAVSLYEETKDADALVAGVERIFGQFRHILEQKGLKRICAVGERFDPELHEAVACVPSDQERNVVLEEFSPGYARSGRTLLPSKVAVSLGPVTGEKEES